MQSRVKSSAVLVLSAVVLCVMAARVVAQSADETDVPERFVLDAGGFNMFVSTNLALNSKSIGGSAISFEDDLNLPATVQRGFVEAFYRVARRHQLSFGYGQLDRTGDGTRLTRDITWGGAVIRAGVSAAGHTDTKILSGAYRWALYKKPRLEFGPAVGFGYLWLTAGITATGGISTSQATTAATFAQEADESVPTGDLGGFANWWVTPRVLVRSDLRYILVKPSDSEASITQGRIGGTWYPWRHLGFGGQYTYDKLRYQRSVVSTDLGGSYRYQGFQILASTAF
jgi:hypothetical protein